MATTVRVATLPSARVDITLENHHFEIMDRSTMNIYTIRCNFSHSYVTLPEGTYLRKIEGPVTGIPSPSSLTCCSKWVAKPLQKKSTNQWEKDNMVQTIMATTYLGMVVYLPSEKLWVRQLGYWNSQYMENKTFSKPPTRWGPLPIWEW